MTAERDRKRDGEPEAEKASDRGFDEALREILAPDEETSCEDADASAFLERLPAARRGTRNPKD